MWFGFENPLALRQGERIRIPNIIVGMPWHEGVAHRLAAGSGFPSVGELVVGLAWC